MSRLPADARDGRSFALTVAMAVIGVGLVAGGLWLGTQQLTAQVVRVSGEARVSTDCGSVFSNDAGIRDLAATLFSGREGCELVLAKSHVAVLLGFSVGTLLGSVAAVRLTNRVRGVASALSA